METDSAQPVSQLVPQTLATLARDQTPTTVKPRDESWNDKRENAKKKWLDKWLEMDFYHPRLKLLADELYDASARIFYKLGPGQGRPILIYGWNGCGKTHACRAMRDWFNTVRISIGPVMGVDPEGQKNSFIPDCTMVNWPQVVDDFKKDQWSIVDRLMEDYFVIIDDIGAEHDPSGIGQDKLYQILSRREHKHTIITTNVQPENFESRWERRIASRLFRNTIEVDLRDVKDFSAR